MRGVAIFLISIILFSVISHDLVEASSPCSVVESETSLVDESSGASSDFAAQGQHLCHAGHCAFLLCENEVIEAQPIAKDFYSVHLSSVPKGRNIELLRPPRV